MAVRGIVLLSGGLDSLLAALLAKRAGLELLGLYFAAPFMKVMSKDKILAISEQLGIQILVKPFGLDFINILRKPRFGYGKNANPCIDCKIYMFKRAKELMDALNMDVLVTGEVLGQRPMTQLRCNIELIERESGLKGRIIRPLSAKLFEPTSFELEGKVDRRKLGAIYGRSRKPQLELAKELGLTTYQTPAGGCHLTNPDFARRMFDLLKNQDKITFKDINLLKVGRHFRLDSGKIIIGRNQKENEHLCARRGFAQACFFPLNFTGPFSLGFGNLTQSDILWTARAIARYSKRAHKVKVGVVNLGQSFTVDVDEPLDDFELKRRLI